MLGFGVLWSFLIVYFPLFDVDVGLFEFPVEQAVLASEYPCAGGFDLVRFNCRLYLI